MRELRKVEGNIVELEVREDGSIFSDDSVVERVNTRGVDISLIPLLIMGLESHYGAGYKVVEVEEVAAC